MKRKRLRVKLKRTEKVVIAVVIMAAIIFLINFVALPLSAEKPRKEGKEGYENKYIVDEVLLSAHRAGGGEAPEETLSAFKSCLEKTDYVVGILEFDLHITKDGELILLHDSTLNRTSDAEEHFGDKKAYAYNYTLAEIKELNMGEKFVDQASNMPYKGLRGADIPDDVRILTLDEILTYVECEQRPTHDMNYIIEIKNKGDLGKKAMDKLYEKMKEYNISDRTIVGTFNDDITKYIDDEYSDKVVRSASIKEALDFYFSFMYGTKMKEVKYSVLQLPYKFAIYNFGAKAIIDYAHSYGLAMQFWTINDPEQVKELTEAGADAIMTDYPDMAYEAIKEAVNNG